MFIDPLQPDDVFYRQDYSDPPKWLSKLLAKLIKAPKEKPKTKPKQNRLDPPKNKAP